MIEVPDNSKTHSEAEIDSRFFLRSSTSSRRLYFFFFFFNDTAPTEIYTLSLHDALPISPLTVKPPTENGRPSRVMTPPGARSEEHTSELQSRRDLVCRLLLEKKKKI